MDDNQGPSREIEGLKDPFGATTPPSHNSDGGCTHRLMVVPLAGTGESGSDGEESGTPDPKVQEAVGMAEGIFEKLLEQEPGSWDDRTRQMGRGKPLDKDMISAMDWLLSEKWMGLPGCDQTLWAINCLIYAGKTWGN